MNEFQKKVKEKIKLYSNRKYLDGYIRDEFLTENGVAEIFLDIQKKEDLFDTWTYGKQIDLERDVYDYIEEKTEMLGNNIPINLHFKGYRFSSNEQGMIRHLLKEHYAIELYKIQKKYEMYYKKICFLILLGFLSLICYAIICQISDSTFFQAVFTFLFTFSLWEATDCIIYAFSEVKDTRDAVTQNLLMSVEFDDGDEKI